VVVDRVVQRIEEARARVPRDRSALVALSGIDASGKGYLAARLADALRGRGLRVAVLGVDGWLNLPSIRFDAERPAERFYGHAIRFDEMFERLVLPFRAARQCRVEADFTDETATAYRRHVYEFADTDVILLEGIFLLQPAFRRHYDLTIWIECSFETALARAVRRKQEGLQPDDTVRAYRTIYFPAQRLHLAKDRPKEAADEVVVNELVGCEGVGGLAVQRSRSPGSDS
jgi:uridine kinase